MEELIERKYVKRTQKDYTMAFKLQLIGEIERGEISRTAAKKKYGIQGDNTILKWLRKYGTFDWNKPVSIKVKQTPEQRIKELEAKLSKLEEENRFKNMKVEMLNTLIEVAEKELNIPIRKKSLPEQSKNIKRRRKNH